MEQIPLAARMRPKTINEIEGQEHLLAPGKLLRRMITADRLSSVILYGPPGTGKTTIANVIAHETNADFQTVNATTAGKADMKAVVDSARLLRDEQDRPTVLFIDEIHRFNRTQQDYLLPYVENGTVILIGATTENPYFEVNGALLSRSRIFELKPLSRENVMHGIRRALTDKENGYGNRNIILDGDALEYMADMADGDMRQALNALELAVETTEPHTEPKSNVSYTHITSAVVEDCMQKRVMRYDKSGDNHYDLISAFIESMKHSEVDAALYYLARMLEGGEDPKYIARRIMVCAFRDIGLADPLACMVAAAAFDCAEKVGLPECADALAMAAIYNATTSKSNSASAALAKAREEVASSGNIPVPAFLQDESYKSAHKLGRGGVSDVFASPEHYDGTDCMPPELNHKKFFTPDSFGHNAYIAKYLAWCEMYRKANPKGE